MEKNLSQNSKKLPKINFNSENHQYIVDGIEVPSVSEIMKPLTEEHYSNIPSWIIDKARKRGTGVHEAIENYVLFDVISEEYSGYVNQFIEWTKKENLKVKKIEFMMSDGTYAGTIDLLVEDEEGNDLLVDVKTTNKIHKELLEIQLSGYDNLLLFYGYNPVSHHVLLLKEDSYKYEPIELNQEGWFELYEQNDKIHRNKTEN